MKINKSKSPFVSGADAPDEKDLVKTLKGERFSDMLDALASGETTPSAAANRTREILAKIALESDLTNDDDVSSALKQSAEVLVKSRLSDKFKQSEQSGKAVEDLSKFVADDPLFKSKLLSVLKKLRDGAN